MSNPNPPPPPPPPSPLTQEATRRGIDLIIIEHAPVALVWAVDRFAPLEQVMCQSAGQHIMDKWSREAAVCAALYHGDAGWRRGVFFLGQNHFCQFWDSDHKTWREKKVPSESSITSRGIFKRMGSQRRNSREYGIWKSRQEDYKKEGVDFFHKGNNSVQITTPTKNKFIWQLSIWKR